MGVVVAALTPEPLAGKALEREGVSAEVVVLDNGYGYGRLLDRLWADGETFVLLEHDVVPWPGAVDALLACDEPWCVHEYPFAANAVRWALGCVKVAERLLRGDPVFRGVMWNQLDAAVVRELLLACPEGPHVHSPPFAHIK